MKSRRGVFVVLCGALVGIGWSVPAWGVAPRAPYTQKKDAAEVTVTGNPDAEKLEVALSGVLTVTLRLEGALGLEVEEVQAVTASKAWIERGGRQKPEVSQAGERKTWKQQFTLEPLEVGDEVALILTPLRFRENANDAWQTIVWDPIPVKVTTEITQADPKELRDITPPEPVSQPEGNGYLWLMWAGGGLIVFALVFGAWEIRRRTSGERKPAIAPERWAVKQLNKIQKMDFTEDGDGIKHHDMVANVLRRYLEYRYRLKAPGKTTAEFLESLRQGGHLTSPQFASLRDALERCDLAKFARVSPTREECIELDQNAQALVAQTSRVGAS
jgi:hypothetical protein